ncbi:MAG: capsid staple protein [bacterium]|jgi:hypothetical protein
MINLAIEPDDGDDTMLGSPESSKYSYGTAITLEEEHVKALGLDKMAVGKKVKVIAFGVISGARIEVGEEETAPNMTIQLTDLEVSAASAVNLDSMYPSMSGAGAD